MGFLDKLREKSFKVELKKAEKKRIKIKAEAKKLAEIDEMKSRLMKARGVRGLTDAEKKALKIKIDKLEARKKAIKEGLKEVLRGLAVGLKDFAQKVDKAYGPEPQRKARKKPSKKRAKKRAKRRAKRGKN